jgi:hypothetical protein
VFGSCGQFRGGTDILRHPSGRQKLLLQGLNVSNQLMAQGFQSPTERSIIKKEASYIFKYPESFSETIDISIDKAQH